MFNHTPEPWLQRPMFDHPICTTMDCGTDVYHNEIDVHDKSGRIICSVRYSTDSPSMGWGQNETLAKWQANAHRIVQCVNALAGIEDVEAFVNEAKRLMEAQNG
jgi:hypothetical protein